MNKKSSLTLLLLIITSSLLSSPENKFASACDKTLTKQKIDQLPEKDKKTTPKKIDEKQVFKPLPLEEKHYSERPHSAYEAPKATFTVALQIIDTNNKNDTYRPATLSETRQSYNHPSSNREVVDKPGESPLKIFVNN